MGLASIFVRLGLDSTGFATGLKRAESQTAVFSNRVKRNLAGMFTAGMFTAATRSVIEYAGRISDLAKTTKLGAETLQEWEFAASQSGTSLDVLVNAFTHLARTNPGKTTAEVLHMFNGIAQAVRNGEISNELGAVTNLLGRGAKDVIPVFTVGLIEVGQQARNLGIIMKDDVIARLDEFGDKLSEMKSRARGGFGTAIATAGVGLLDILNKAEASIAKMAAGVGARSMLARAGMGGEDADKLAQEIAFEQVFGARARAEVAKYVTSLTGKKGEQSLLDVSRGGATETEFTRSGRWSNPSVTSMQQVGAFIAGQPALLVETKEQTKKMAKAVDLLQEIKDQG